MEATTTIRKYRFFSHEFVNAYFITMRPYLLFVSGITGIAGISFVENIGGIAGIVVFCAAFLSYGFGQALTDCFQTDTDSISSPYRPLTQGVVSKAHFFWISIIGLTICVAVFSYYYQYNILLGVIAGLGLGTYTYFKKKWWSGPFYNAWIVCVLFLISFLAASEEFTGFYSLKFYLGAGSVFWGYSNFVLSGYFKDISADRVTGYKTLPVVFGRKTAARVSDIFAILTILCALLSLKNITYNFLDVFNSFAVILFISAGIFALILSQIKLHFVKTDKDSHPAIVLNVHSYILILSAVSISQKPAMIFPLLIFYIAFNITMNNRPEKSQI